MNQCLKRKLIDNAPMAVSLIFFISVMGYFIYVFQQRATELVPNPINMDLLSLPAVAVCSNFSNFLLTSSAARIDIATIYWDASNFPTSNDSAALGITPCIIINADQNIDAQQGDAVLNSIIGMFNSQDFAWTSVMVFQPISSLPDGEYVNTSFTTVPTNTQNVLGFIKNPNNFAFITLSPNTTSFLFLTENRVIKITGEVVEGFNINQNIVVSPVEPGYMYTFLVQFNTFVVQEFVETPIDDINTICSRLLSIIGASSAIYRAVGWIINKTRSKKRGPMFSGMHNLNTNLISGRDEMNFP
jgi:hypothetical protein